MRISPGGWPARVGWHAADELVGRLQPLAPARVLAPWRRRPKCEQMDPGESRAAAAPRHGCRSASAHGWLSRRPAAPAPAPGAAGQVMVGTPSAKVAVLFVGNPRHPPSALLTDDLVRVRWRPARLRRWRRVPPPWRRSRDGCRQVCRTPSRSSSASAMLSGVLEQKRCAARLS